MKCVILFSLLFLKLSTALFAQNLQRTVIKPAIDTSVFGRWPSADIPSISSDGSYAFYTIRHQPAEGSTLVIRSLKNEWKREIVNASNALFTDDSRKVVFINSRKILCSLYLGSDDIDSIAKASSYKLIKQNGEEWLVYQLNNTAKELRAINLESNIQKSFNGVINYLFSADGNVLVLLKQSNTDNKLQTIDWINFSTGNVLNIWNGNGAKNFVFNKVRDQLAFVVETKDSSSKEGKTEKSIFYYKGGKDKAVLLADNRARGVDSNLIVNGISDFSKDGENLYIFLKEEERHKPQSGAVMVDVWSYQDAKLQSMQLAELSNSGSYKAAIRINNHQVVRLQQEGDRSVSIIEKWSNKVFVSHCSGDVFENYWNAASRQSYYLVSTYNGASQQLKIRQGGFVSPTESVSPGGKYIIGGVTSDHQNLYCYNIETGKIENLTHSISAPSDKEFDDKSPPGYSKWLEMGCWLDNDKGILLFDRYDTWLVDPAGIQSPVNLTNSYGKKNKIVFRLPEIYQHKSIRDNSKIFLKGFNRINKEEGLYEIQLGNHRDPKLLTKSTYRYEIPDNVFNSAQLDSSSSQRFLLRRESATQSPNYFLTSDFKTFIPVTDVYPERSYNWLTTELHTWKGVNGESLQGVLYKPENFDPKKKYPVIFHYYERMSDQLNKYLEPKAITDHLNIPWFVSNGYLVFTPDIHYEIGKTGESALNAVVSAAHYLQKFPWVNAKRMGLQGQSFAGYETNYIVTHSNLFAAAMSSSGFSDFISDYDATSHGGMSNQIIFEIGQNRIGANLWERPDLYIKNSPIFQADKVTTPILIMSNNNDRAVPFTQGLELFIALRRLGKRAWLLQYDNGDHLLFKKEDALQHTIRMTQFFDHYLKDSACPRWMLYGIRAKDKGIEDGLQLVYEKDKTGKWLTPKEGGLLTDEEKKKVEALKHRKAVTVTIE